MQAAGKSGSGKRERKAPEELRKFIQYDPVTGILRWRERMPQDFTCDEKERRRVSTRWNMLRAGKEVGALGPRGYIVVCIEAKTYFAHRIAWAVHFGVWPSGQIDHINHQKQDNRLVNLRDVTASENSRNKPLFRTNVSGNTGVYFRKSTQRWRATIWDGERRVELGTFISKDLAITARLAAQRDLNFHDNHGATR